MAAIVELVPLKKIEGATFEQPTDSVVDVSGYTEAFLQWTVVQIDRNSQPTTILIQTAIDNRDEQYVTLASYEYSSDPSLPAHQHFYLAGSTTGSSSAPGFGRYLRIRVDQDSAASITLVAKAVLKP